jgi:peptidyl-prolyl cis-trans isomerase B (cyclophilin B)
MVPLTAKPSIRWFCIFLLLLTQPLRAAVREIATISTSLGAMEFELFSDVSPRAVANFKYLADTKFYDNTAFHRLIQGFMVQGGDPLTRGTTASAYNEYSSVFGQGGPEYTIPNEPTPREDRAHVRGVLSMAKTEAADSGGSQFFVMFGDAPWLNEVHAPMGRLVSGETTLQAIEVQSKGGKDLPTRPIIINSVSVRAERTNDAPTSSMRFQPGTLGGLLRRSDRNQDHFVNLVVQYNNGANNGELYRGPLLSFDKNMDARGSYQITLTRGGAFSAQIQYYGRRNTLTGFLRQNSPSLQEADYTGKLDSASAVPIRVKIRARETPQGATTLTVAVFQAGPGELDLEDESSCIANGALLNESTLADRYNVELASPLSSHVKSDNTPADSSLVGSGFLTVHIRAKTGQAIVAGKLPDNTSFTFSRSVSNEGGRFTLPIYVHELQRDFETRRPEFPSFKLSDWYSLSKYFNFPFFKNRFVGALELPPKPTLPLPKNIPGNWLIWVRQGKAGGPAPNQITAYVVPNVASWTPPSAGQMLSPFSSSGTAQLLNGGSLVGSFRVAKSNASAVFTVPNASAQQMRFNPVDGTFQGSFVDASLPARPRRIFQGVLLQKEGINKGVGFLLTEGASVPVVLAPQGAL